MTNETTVRIVDHKRILRILQRLSRESIPIFIRTEYSSTVAVKARCGHVEKKGEKYIGFHIHGLSEKGIQHLKGRKHIHLEFMMLSTKIITAAYLRQVADHEGRIFVSIPETLISVQRRANERIQTHPMMQPYLQLSPRNVIAGSKKRKLDENQVLSMFPNWHPYQDFQDYLVVKDVSAGGLAVQTVFPGNTRGLLPGLVDYNAQLVLSMFGKVQVGVELRWNKRLQQTQKYKGKDSKFFTHLFGFSFVPDRCQEGFESILATFMRQMARQEGI